MQHSVTSKAFTLIELLTVIAIIGILAGILLPTLGMARESARRIKCNSNLAQIGKALAMYAANYGEELPDVRPFPDNYDDDPKSHQVSSALLWNGSEVTGLGALYGGLIKIADRDVFICPSAKRRTEQRKSFDNFPRPDQEGVAGENTESSYLYRYREAWGPGDLKFTYISKMADGSTKDLGLQYATKTAVVCDNNSTYAAGNPDLGSHNHRGKGVNVLFLDWHVEWLPDKGNADGTAAGIWAMWRDLDQVLKVKPE